MMDVSVINFKMEETAKKERNKLIIALNMRGCTTSDIKKLLKLYSGEDLGLRQIQRILKICGASDSATNEAPLSEIVEAIDLELKGSGSLLGYRALWNKLKNNHKLSVKRNTVMMLLAIMDKTGTAQRKTRRLKRRIYRSKGPNYAWHCDGYDKLKPFGLPIHGCIDGYSRKVLWLKVAYSNNEPSFIADHYLNCVLSLKGCPRLLRTDLGTENTIISFLQPALRHQDIDCWSGFKSHRYVFKFK